MAIQLSIVKRSGDIVTFDEDRIRRAIVKAATATKHQLTDEQMDSLMDDILLEVRQRFTEFFPNVENIQDIVEKQLMHHDQFEIAKAYILYRAKRKEQRAVEKEQRVKESYLGKLKIIKRDGRTTLINVKKIRDTLERARAGLEDHITDADVSHLIKEVVKNLYDGAKTTEIEDAMILASTSFIEKNPEYSTLASRLMRQKLIKEVTGTNVDEDTIKARYEASFVNSINEGIKQGIYDDRLADFDLKKIAEYIRPERDDLLSYMSLRTLYERYLVHTVEGDVLELPQTFFMRVAMGLAIEEENKTTWTREFYDLMSVLRYLPSTPTLFHSGTHRPQLSSCYLTTVQDDLKDIFKAYSDNAQLSKWSGGLGNDWTNIRATGSMIQSTRVESQGVIPFLKIANDTTAAINRSGKRRGATCAYLETWHLDIEDFIDLRRNTGDERRRTHDMNTSNWIPDLFMKRVLSDETWTLFSPEEVPELHELYGSSFEKKYIEYEKKAQNGQLAKHKVVQAKALWRKMLSRLFETGHPWITFKDPCNIRSPQDHAGVIHSSNLCTEITLNTSQSEHAVCNLGSINLGRHVIDSKVDKDLLASTIEIAMRMLDNVINLCFYPTKEAAASNLKHRPVGLGVMGFQDLLFEMKVPFESPKALQIADSTQEFVSYHAILASSKLAKEKGTYQSYEGSKWSRGIFPQDTITLLEEERGMDVGTEVNERMDWTKVREHVAQHGMRNSNTMAIAPTATISTISGCYPGIEPIYKNIYVKSNMTGEFVVINSHLVEDLRRLGKWNQEMVEQLKFHDGDLDGIAAIPEELKLVYKESFAVDPIWAIRMTAQRGVWIDQSQSHNVFMRGTSGKMLQDIYEEAWKYGMKTTYYLRTLGKSQVEKSTLDAKKYGFTQTRFDKTVPQKPKETEQVVMATQEGAEVKLCRIEDPDCEACQ